VLADGVDMGMKMLMMAVPGVPGEDYPILQQIPDSTDFSCQGRTPGGYYADSSEVARCQVFHVCGITPNQQFSFLCPNGTIFNQEYFICDWWFNVDCSLSESLYSLVDEVEEAAASQVKEVTYPVEEFEEVAEVVRPDTIYSAIEAANHKYGGGDFSEDPPYSAPAAPVAPSTGYGVPLADPITEYISPLQSAARQARASKSSSANKSFPASRGAARPASSKSNRKGKSNRNTKSKKKHSKKSSKIQKSKSSQRGGWGKSGRRGKASQSSWQGWVPGTR